MYNEKEIQVILVHIIKEEEKFKRFTTKKEQEKQKVPEYYPEYPKIVDIAERLSYHHDMDVFPEEILKEKAPNQQAEEWDYAKANYKPKTVPFWEKAESSIGRIWNKDNYSMKFPEDKPEFEENSAEKYFKEEVPFYRSILNFMENICTSATLRDPNSIEVIKPRELPFKKDEDDNLINDQSQLIEPIPVIYRAEQIVSYIQDDRLMILLDKKSIVVKGGKKVKEGNIYEFYDEKNIWRITQIDDIRDNKYNIEIYYEHGLDEYPFRKMPGKPVQKKGLNYNVSYFQKALPNLDDAIANQATLMMSIYTQAYPQRWSYVDRCKEPGCINGKTQASDGQWADCSKCDGTGRIGKKSPTGEYQITVAATLSDGQVIPSPPFGYVAPDPKILEYLDNHIKNTIIDAFAFLNIDVSNSEVKGSETALGKQIDREEFFSFLVHLSNQMFLLLEWTIHIMGNMRYEGFEDPEIIKPSNFTIRSFSELTDEISKAKEAGIPEIVLAKLLDEYAKGRFNTDKEFGKIMKLALKLDELVIKSDEEITLGLTTNTISKKDVILHNGFLQFVEKGMLEKKNFLDSKIEDIKAFLDEQAEAKLLESKPAAPTTEQILTDANTGTP
jgi:hypothetical protein